MNDQTQIGEILHSRKHFLLTTHFRPDGDAIGSVSGLAHSLAARGAKVKVVLAPGPSTQYDFLLADIPHMTLEELTPAAAEAIIILDSGDFSRTGIDEQLRALHLPTINIDHHATNPSYGDFNWVDATASSTSEMITLLIEQAELPLPINAAEALYLGIYTDTRFFQNDSVRPDTFRSLAYLLSSGLNPSPVIRSLTQNKTLTDIKTLGLGLSHIETAADGKIVFTVVRAADLKRVGAESQNCWSAGLFSQVNSIKGALVAVSFVEEETGVIFCEFRAKYGFDVRDVALAFGGGGHKAASGCSQKKPLEQLQHEVLGFLTNQVQGHEQHLNNQTHSGQ